MPTVVQRRVRGPDIEVEAFLKCRTYNHAWDEFYPIDLEQPWYGWRLSLRCVRCQTERHDNIDFKGQVMGRRYIYPPGYQQTEPGEKKDRTVFREELFDQLRARLAEVNGIGASERPEGAEVTPIKAARQNTAKAAEKTARKGA
jgi:hypothetical protein